eukprot:CAMPEP_0176027434 /NCGR_PEP_ID=MMETSP0120_2-20121206/13453_1 /TAXON_ID=160619 /ORGANISM="Kryptoperidinium foliaceum, Strain CCMP 1326" /LENGTH=532 /DNA_ID=CAMNT_0017360639 /DNA_START=13 /DNA_END=1611 /DNA_ORIENTATION=-
MAFMAVAHPFRAPKAFHGAQCPVAPMDSGESGSDTSDDESLRNLIDEGQRALMRIRCRVASVLLFVAVVLTIAYEALVRATEMHAKCYEKCGCPLALHFQAIAMNLCGHFRYISLCLAPLAGDVILFRVALCADACVMSHVLIKTVLIVARPRRVTTHLLGEIIVLLTGTLFIMGTIAAMCRRDAIAMERDMWRVMATFLAFGGIVFSCGAVLETVTCRQVSPHVWYGISFAVALYFVKRPNLRAKIQAWLYPRVARGDSRMAAGIAGFIGGCTAEDALKKASSRFRCIRLADITFEDIQDNSPTPGLFERGIHTHLHSCDAFVSHSWREDPVAKWEALQAWRKSFLKEYKREPLVWLDKACIDQNNIDEDLQGLPIFLSGCSTLLVLCGPTYLSRLWCVLELFTFVHMGGALERIKIHRLTRRGQTAGDLNDISNSFTDFDVGRCDCYHLADKERMLSIVRAAFGDLELFNEAVREMFDRIVHNRRPRGLTDRSISVSSGSSEASGTGGNLLTQTCGSLSSSASSSPSYVD